MEKHEFFLEVQKIKAQLLDYNLRFTTEEIEYTKIKEIVHKDTKTEKEVEMMKDDSQMIKFIGVKWYINKENKAWFDYKDYIWKIPT